MSKYTGSNWKYLIGTKRRYKIYYDGRVWIEARRRFALPFKDEKGYLRVSVDGKQRRVHVIVAEHFKKIPKGFAREQLKVNHKDRKRDNPHGDNLEWATHAENLLHQGMGRKRGVIQRGDKYIATLTKDKKTKYLGSFCDIEEAYAAYYNEYEKTYGIRPW